MSELAILLGTASIAFGVSRFAGIPVVALLVLCGTIMEHIIELPRDLLKTSMELGLAFLLFSMGIELSPERFRNRFGTVLVIALFQLLAAGGGAWAICALFGLSKEIQLAVALSLAASSTIAVVRHLRKRSQLYEPFGRLVTGVLLVQDIIVLIFILFWQKTEIGGDLWNAALAVTIIALLALILHMRIVPWLVRRYSEDTEILLLIALAVLFGFLGAADYLNLPAIAGAFAAGFSLSAFPVNGLMRAQLNSITDFFLAFFFVSVGALITIPSIHSIYLTMALIVMLFTVTPLVVRVVAETFGISSRSSIESGLLLAQAGELSLAAALYAMGAGRIDAEIFSVIALTTVVTMAITPLIATDKTTFRLMHSRFLKRKPEKPNVALSDHIVIVGYGTVGRRILPDLYATGRKIVIIDDDRKVIAALSSEERVFAIKGDSMNTDVLEAASVKQAHTVFCFARRVEDSLTVLQYANSGKCRIVVRVPDEAAADRVRKNGGIPISTMQDAIDTFLVWLGSDFSRRQIRRLVQTGKAI